MTKVQKGIYRINFIFPNLFLLGYSFYLDIPILPIAVDQNYFELDRDQITLGRLLGSGNFGQVFKAIYKASQLDVAVKSLKGIGVFPLFFAFRI